MKILITSALPYANGPLHFGHIAGAYLPGDVYARFQRLRGADVLYLCGSDEYGVAITLSAELSHRTPKEHVDLFHTVNRAFFEKLEFSFDYYGRTTGPCHASTVQDFYKDLQDKGFIEERTDNHLYSEKEGRFLADRYVVGTCPKCGYPEARGDECQKCAASYEAVDLKHPRSKLTGAPLTLRPSKHLYLRFDKFKDSLEQWIRSKSWKENVVHFAMRYIEDLRPRAITRDSSWGVPVPGYPDKVFYVWFDAPIGYVSIAKEWAQSIHQPDRWKDYWLDPKTKLVHFIGKDNIPFHAVFFPAMLMGQTLPYKLPDEVPANEFYMLEGRQFSKSDGWTIDLDEFFQNYTADQIRYAIAANAPETSDADFSWKDFQMRCNAELLGKFGNFVHRTLTFIQQKCGGKAPQAASYDLEDSTFHQKMYSLLEEAASSYEHFRLRRATQVLMELAQLGNGYFDAAKPWILAKDPAHYQKLHTVLALCLDCIKILGLIASPIIPASAQKIWQMLGHASKLETLSWQTVAQTPLKAGTLLPEPLALFRKIEESEIETQIAKLEKLKMEKEKAEAPLVVEPIKKTISFEDFDKVDIRVVKVLEAAKVAKSKKLLQLKIDLGFETRNVVSGIAQHFEPEELIGKQVLFLANLAPATLMGIESQGMILAASSGSKLDLPVADNIALGAQVS